MDDRRGRRSASDRVPASPGGSASSLAPAGDRSGGRRLDDERIALEVERLSLYYGETRALNEITMRIASHRVTAFIGPSGCGKSTLLRCFNRMNDLVPNCRVQGEVRLLGENVYASDVDVSVLRRRVGMVFQKPNPFPKSIYENVAYGLRLQGMKARADLDERIEWALRSAALWDEVKDRLDAPGTGLSGGQQQRLCIALGLSGGQQQRLVIARAIAIEPEVLLLDEPASALDPISTLKIEELITQLAHDYTIVIVTHNMQQAARVSDYTAFLYLGDLIEFNDTDTIFTNPARKHTEDYITGRYG